MSGRERTMLLRWGKQVGNPIPSRRSKVREIDRRYAQEAERPGIGYLLEQARVNHGVSLEEAAQATRIRRDYLEKLESDDHSARAHFQRIPDNCSPKPDSLVLAPGMVFGRSGTAFLTPQALSA